MLKPYICLICGEPCEEEEKGGSRFHKGLCAHIVAHYIYFDKGQLKIADKTLETIRQINKNNP